MGKDKNKNTETTEDTTTTEDQTQDPGTETATDEEQAPDTTEDPQEEAPQEDAPQGNKKEIVILFYKLHENAPWNIHPQIFQTEDQAMSKCKQLFTPHDTELVTLELPDDKLQ